MWPDIAAWFQSPGGARVLQTAIVPALAILVAGLLAALISRAALRAALRRADREQAATAVAGLVEAARAASDSDGARDRRRAARLRTEADVRMRLLPLQGADRAADWAAAATEALAATHGSGAATDLAAVRDPLVAWVRNPRRAKRLFARPAAVTAPAPARPADDATTPAEERPGQEQDRFGPLRTRADADLPPVRTDDEDDQAVPAWRRTRSAERLQQEHDARTEPETEPDAADEGTAPSRRLDEPQQAEDQEQADAQPARRTTAVAVDADAEPQPARARPVPEWLGTYDDDAEVTQNLDLRTPPPVSATKVRDRSPAADIVPRP